MLLLRYKELKVGGLKTGVAKTSRNRLYICTTPILVNMFVSLGRALPASVATLSGRWCSRRSYSASSSLPHAPNRRTRGANLYYSTHARQGTSKSPDNGEDQGAGSSISTDLLNQAAMEYNGPLDVPTAFLSKYRLAGKGDVAGVFL